MRDCATGFRLRPWLAGQLVPANRTHTYLQAFRLQDAVWVSTPCDFSGELALGIKDFLLARTGRQAVITSSTAITSATSYHAATTT